MLFALDICVNKKAPPDINRIFSLFLEVLPSSPHVFTQVLQSTFEEPPQLLTPVIHF